MSNTPVKSDKINMDRRSFLTTASTVGAGFAGAALLAGFGGKAEAAPYESQSASATSLDTTLLTVAIIAETLAVTTYTDIINGTVYPLLIDNLADRQYLQAAREEEQIHLNLLVSATGIKPPIHDFYFPTGMFSDPGVTFSTLLTFEEAFIAAYLLANVQLSTQGLRTLAAQIMGVEAEHRTLARVIGNDLGLASLTGLFGVEPIVTSNNFAFEQTAGLTDISQAVNVLLPYINQAAAMHAGFTLERSYAAVSTSSPITLFSSTP